MTRSGRSALVEHHPWLRRLSPNFPGQGLASCNPWNSRLPHDALARLRFTPGRKGGDRTTCSLPRLLGWMQV
jgi:hypothetical protein